MEEFKPLDQYGNWVSHPMYEMGKEEMNEVKFMLEEQIHHVIPKRGKYRRCVMFTVVDDIEKLIRTISWKYTPDIRIIDEELAKIEWSLLHEPERVEYTVKGAPALDWTGVDCYQAYKRTGGSWQLATPWMFISAERAWKWIDRKLEEDSHDSESIRL